jgi:hypothetical protein
VAVAIILLFREAGHAPRDALCHRGELLQPGASRASLLCISEERLERRDDLRIELRAGAAAQLLKGLAF